MYSLIIFSFSVYWLYRGQRIYEVFGFWDKNCTRQVWSNIILQRFWNVTMTCAAFHVISSEFQFFFFFFFNREAINRVCEAAGLKTAKKRKVPYILSLSLSQKYYGGTLNYKIYLFKTWMSIIFPSKQTLSFLLCLWQGFSTEISVKDHKLKNDAPFLQCMAHSMYI